MLIELYKLNCVIINTSDFVLIPDRTAGAEAAHNEHPQSIPTWRHPAGQLHVASLETDGQFDVDNQRCAGNLNNHFLK